MGDAFEQGCSVSSTVLVGNFICSTLCGIDNRCLLREWLTAVTMKNRWLGLIFGWHDNFSL